MPLKLVKPKDYKIFLAFFYRKNVNFVDIEWRCEIGEWRVGMKIVVFSPLTSQISVLKSFIKYQ